MPPPKKQKNGGTKPQRSPRDEIYEGEALGRKLAVASFKDAPGGLVQRVDRSSLALKIRLLTIAEVLVACGVALPPDPLRTSSAAELLIEAQYQHRELRRFSCTQSRRRRGCTCTA